MVASSTSKAALGGLLCVAVGVGLGLLCGGRREQPVWTPAPISPAATMSPLPPSFADVVDRVADGVVTVRALRTRIDGQAAAEPNAVSERENREHPYGRVALRTGSGFVCSSQGLVVTSRHVIAGAFDVDVVVPGRESFAAAVVGEDPATDLALLRLADAPRDLTVLPLATQDDLRAGDWIVAVGNPFGYERTVTAGIVSFVGRHLHHSDFQLTTDFLQISAPVNPGSSGCPVVDLRGRVVGVTTQAPAEAQGISFAVPSHTLRWTLDQMQRSPDGRVHRGYLGIEFATLARHAGPGTAGGALITQVMDGKPAHRAGVRPGDVVIGIDDVAVGDARSLHERIVCSLPGTAVALQVLRGGRADAADSIVAVLGEVAAAANSTPN